MGSVISTNNYKSIGWSFVDRFGSQGIAFIFNIFLTRILTPADFGLIGMILVLIALGQTLIDSGMTSSLIRKADLDSMDFSVVFVTNLTLSILIYCIIFFLSPFVSVFYNQPELTQILRVYSLGFIFIAFSAIQQTILVKDLSFKKLSKIRIPATLLSGVLGVGLALNGYGVWSLVWMYVFNQLLLSCLFIIFGNWKPKIEFSILKFKEHFTFGYRLTLAGILNTLFDNLYHILIGRFFAVSALGFYTRAYMIKQYPVENFSSALQKVTYPLFSKQKKDLVELKESFKELTHRVIFIIAPMMLLGSALGQPLFMFLFGEDWLPAVPYFQILCFTGVLYPIHAYNLNILNVFGRSDLFLKLEVIKKIQIVVVVLIGFQFGIYGLIWAQVLSSVSSFAINTFYTGRFINFGFFDQLSIIVPIILTAFVSAFVIYMVLDSLWMDQINPFLTCVFLAVLGTAIYLILNFLIKSKPAMDLFYWTKLRFEK